MKKKLAIMALAAALVFSTGCSKAQSGSDSVLDDISDVPPVSYVPPSGSDSDVSKDKGEPTFLICPDGTPVYTSEITSVFTGSDEYGDRRDITLEEAERLAHEGGDFTVICSGFVYGYLPETAFNRIDDPDMFEDQGDGVNYRFIGEALPPLTGYTRFEVGGKIGTLTVKSASVYFGIKSMGMSAPEFSDKPGIYYRGGSVEFDGTAELSGYVSVAEMDVMYGKGGMITLYPDKKSCSKLPIIGGYWNSELERLAYSPYSTFYGFYGYAAPELGVIGEVTADTGSLKPGDLCVKAAVKIKDIGYEFNPDFGMTFQHMTLDEIRF